MAAERRGRAGTRMPQALRIVRVLAPNPSLLTGPGTNTWLVGDDEVTVIDPGPDDPRHRSAILKAAEPGAVVRVVCTHGHLDHSEGAAALAAVCGVGVGVHHSRALERGQLALHDDDRLEVGPHALRVVDTPGHAPDHLCLLAESDGACFTGDHVLGGTTTVIDPPGGELAAYLRSLERLRALRPRVLLPGHGEPLPDPPAAIEGILRHRAAREAAILAALGTTATSPGALVPALYADVDPARWPAAARTVLAHLLKLAGEGRVERAEDEPSAEPRFTRRG